MMPNVSGQVIEIPVKPNQLVKAGTALGMPGSATVFADNAGVIGLLMSILVWISSYTAYL